MVEQRNYLSMDRRRGIVRCHLAGWTVDEIRDATGISLLTVRKWIDRYEQEGWGGLRTRARKDRERAPNLLPEFALDELLRLVRLHPDWTANQLAKALTPIRYPLANHRVCGSTVAGALARQGYRRVWVEGTSNK